MKALVGMVLKDEVSTGQNLIVKTSTVNGLEVECFMAEALIGEGLTTYSVGSSNIQIVSNFFQIALFRNRKEIGSGIELTVGVIGRVDDNVAHLRTSESGRYIEGRKHHCRLSR